MYMEAIENLTHHLLGSEVLGALKASWSSLGHSEDEQCHLFQSFVLDKLLKETSYRFVATEVSKEREQAALAERLFDEVVHLSRRLDEQIFNPEIREVVDFLFCRAASVISKHLFRDYNFGKSCTSPSSDRCTDISSTGAIPPANASCHTHIIEEPSLVCTSARSVLACADISLVPWESFMNYKYASSSPEWREGVLLVPKTNSSIHQVIKICMPKFGASCHQQMNLKKIPNTIDGQFSFLNSANLPQQISALQEEKERLYQQAEERIEYLCLIAHAKAILQLPLKLQGGIRDTFAKSLFFSSTDEGEESHKKGNIDGCFLLCSPRTSFSSIDSSRAKSPVLPCVGPRGNKKKYPVEHPLNPNSIDYLLKQMSTCGEMSSETNNDGANQVSHSTSTTNPFSEIERLGFKQDLSMLRVEREASDCLEALEISRNELLAAVDVERLIIQDLLKLLNIVESNDSDPTDEDIHHEITDIDKSIREAKANNGISTLYEDTSVLFHQYPTPISRLYAFVSPDILLAHISGRRLFFQAMYYDERLVKFEEMHQKVNQSYTFYFDLTKDVNFSGTSPSYKSWINNIMLDEYVCDDETPSAFTGIHEIEKLSPRSDSEFGSCLSVASNSKACRIYESTTEKNCDFASVSPSNAATRSFQDFKNKLNRVNTGIAQYEKYYDEISEKIKILVAAIPLLKHRDGLLKSVRISQEGKRERLMSRSRDQQRWMKLETRIKNCADREIPKLVGRIVKICDQWEKKTGTRMILNGKDVIEVMRSSDVYEAIYPEESPFIDFPATSSIPSTVPVTPSESRTVLPSHHVQIGSTTPNRSAKKHSISTANSSPAFRSLSKPPRMHGITIQTTTTSATPVRVSRVDFSASVSPGRNILKISDSRDRSVTERGKASRREEMSSCTYVPPKSLFTGKILSSSSSPVQKRARQISPQSRPPLAPSSTSRQQHTSVSASPTPRPKWGSTAPSFCLSPNSRCETSSSKQRSKNRPPLVDNSPSATINQTVVSSPVPQKGSFLSVLQKSPSSATNCEKSISSIF